MAYLAPYPKFRAVDDDNLPLVGGLLYTYAPGTSTPKAVYTDKTLGTAHANPVVLDALGEATIFIDGDTDFVLQDATTAQRWGPIRSTDATSGNSLTNATLAGTLTVTSTAVTWSGNPTHSGNHTFDGNVTVNGNTALGNASTDTLTIAPSAVTWSNNPTHSGNHTFSGNLTVNGNTVLGNAGSDTVTLTAATTITGDVTVSTTGGELYPNKYTPTLTNSTNVASSTAREHRYVRVGDFVILNGSVSVTPTAAAATATQLGIALPIATNLSGVYDIRCAAAADTTLGNATGFISADTINDRAVLNFEAGSTSACGWSYTFIYEVKA